MASEGLFSGCWTPATLRTFQVPLRASQLKVKAFYTRVGALADLKISKACRNIYRRIFSGGVIAWHGRNDLRDTTGLPFAKLTRIDIPVRSLSRTRTWLGFVACFRKTRCCGQECPRAALNGYEPSRFAARRNKPGCLKYPRIRESAGPLQPGTIRGPPSLKRPWELGGLGCAQGLCNRRVMRALTGRGRCAKLSLKLVQDFPCHVRG